MIIFPKLHTILFVNVAFKYAVFCDIGNLMIWMVGHSMCRPTLLCVKNIKWFQPALTCSLPMDHQKVS